MQVRLQVRVAGVVQGVGFRPFVHRLANDLGLGGWVSNDGQGVLIELCGFSVDIDTFLVCLSSDAPPLAEIESVSVGEVVHVIGDDSELTFSIRPSLGSDDATALVPADVRTCEECLREMRDSTNRRYRHPFINCTNCGPRFTIIRAVPYDRANTTMSVFAMCELCTDEYRDPTNRRFHAEPICCRDCGPRLRFHTVANDTDDPKDTNIAERNASVTDESAIAQAITALRDGLIVAVKGIGGYALLVDSNNDDAVSRLRHRKHRDEKPFALQVSSLKAAQQLVELSNDEVRALCGTESPIVLARKIVRSDLTGLPDPVSSYVAPGSDVLGIMLPSTGLHHLLGGAFEVPLVLTSGNRSNEPIAFDDHDARHRLADIADAFLSHDRRINRRADDSILRSIGTALTPLRRARGYVPKSVVLPGSQGGLNLTVLGVGAELKNTICLSRGRRAFLSTHLGDLEHVEAFRSFRESINDLQAFLNVRPNLVVHDLHPEYLSTKWATEQDVETLAVQHHHAHIAACLADNGVEGPVVGLAFDGHGYGPDGTLWGGEFLVADLSTYERVGHFMTVALPGGGTAIRDPWRMAVAYLMRAYEGRVPVRLAVRQRNVDRWDDVEAVAVRGNSIQTSSVGRLFDAIAAILGIRDRNSYEGQAATELEQAASRSRFRSEDASAPMQFEALGMIEQEELCGMIRLDPSVLLRSLAEEVADQTLSASRINDMAWIAHRHIADASIDTAKKVCARVALSTVALSGGVFQNALLADMIRSGLDRLGIAVITHRKVPPNDGGISLGQVAIGRAYWMKTMGAGGNHTSFDQAWTGR